MRKDTILPFGQRRSKAGQLLKAQEVEQGLPGWADQTNISVHPKEGTLIKMTPVMSKNKFYQSVRLTKQGRLLFGYAILFLMITGCGMKFYPTATATPTPLAVLQIKQLTRLGFGTIKQIALNPTGSTLAVASSIGVWLYDLKTLKRLRLLESHSGSLNSVVWSPDGTRLVTTSSEGTVQVWNADRGQSLQILEAHPGHLNRVVWSPDGTQLATASPEGTVQVWNADRGQSLQILEAHPDDLASIAWSPDGTQLAAASSDHNIRIWDTTSGHLSQLLEGHFGAVEDIVWSPNSTLLASIGAAHFEDDIVRVWDVTRGRQLYALTGHQEAVTRIAWSSEDTRLASASLDKTIRVWDAKSGDLLYLLEGHLDWVESIAWSPDDIRLASGSRDGAIRIWLIAPHTEKQVVEEQKPLTLTGHSGSVIDVGWTHLGSRLVSLSHDIRVWNITSGQQLGVLNENTARMEHLAWSPDGSRLAAASEDGMIRVWALRPGLIDAVVSDQEPRLLRGHRAVAWSPDSTMLASASWDGTVRIWEIVR